jgi:hypothetical protein
LRSCSHERLGATFLNQVSILIQNFSVPCNDASPSSCLSLQRNNDRLCVDRVAEGDWSVEFPFEDCQERQGVDARRLAHEAGGDGQTKQSVSHGPAEGIASGGRMIDMKGVKIARQSGEEDNIGFRHGPSWTLPLITDHEIIE